MSDRKRVSQKKSVESSALANRAEDRHRGTASQSIAHSPALAAQLQLQTQLQNSPYVTEQRKGIAGAMEAPVQREEDEIQAKLAPVQREEDEIQAKFAPVQREEDEIQAKFDPVQREEDEIQAKFAPVQREEDEIQAKFAPVQREEDEIQAKLAPIQREEDEIQAKFPPVQRAGDDLMEDEAVGQRKAIGPPQSATTNLPAQRKEDAGRPNNTGLPDNLKSGIESLSGMSMDSVKVHYNSPQPAQLNALAYAQGTDIHVAPGQEKHLPHEAWHVVQQAQGRVQPTMQMKQGVPINDDRSLETEADVMGAKAQALGTEVVSQGVTGFDARSAQRGSAQLFGEAPAQLKKTTKDYLEDAQEQEDDEQGALQDVEDEIWESDDSVIDYAETQLSLAGYTGWTGTDSDHGDYTRFIWEFNHGVIVGANVHYTAGGKVAGNWYIKGVGGSAPTFAQVVTNAPAVRPATTMPWP